MDFDELLNKIECYWNLYLNEEVLLIKKCLLDLIGGLVHLLPETFDKGNFIDPDYHWGLK